MEIIAIIPARGGSKGIKNKNIYPIKNKPLIQWTFDQVSYSKYINSIFVSTDDKKIIELAKKSKFNVIKRPKHLSTDRATSESAIIHALHEINFNYKIYPDIVVFLQATSPLRKIDDIDNAIDLFINEKADSLFSATQISDLTLWKYYNDKWESVNFDYNNRKRRQEMPLNYIENGSIYMFKQGIIENYNNRLGGKIVVYEMDFWQTWEIDSIEEVELIEYYIKKHNLNSYD